jgi:peptide/nickel transport system permease protein
MDPLKGAFRRVAKPHDSQNDFGTDQIGRDTLSQVIYGARSFLVVSFSALWLGTIVGSLHGLTSGCLSGKFDVAGQRVMRILRSFPELILP